LVGKSFSFALDVQDIVSRKQYHDADKILFSDLDFLDNIKLVNYIRTEVKNGNNTPDVSSKSKFEDDAYLKPVLEDDALLYSLDDLAEEQGEESTPSAETNRQVTQLQEELEQLQTQFSEYRIAVQKSMDDQLSKEDEKLAEATPKPSAHTVDRLQEADDGYFVSYAYNGKTRRLAS
jgi:protein arginine N-methyltransferase 3